MQILVLVEIRKDLSYSVRTVTVSKRNTIMHKPIFALESNVPYKELIEVELNNDTLKIDGNLAVCWSSNLDFTVERSTKTLIGSAVSGEGLVNIYRGTGKVLMSPVAPTESLYASTSAKPLK